MAEGNNGLVNQIENLKHEVMSLKASRVAKDYQLIRMHGEILTLQDSLRSLINTSEDPTSFEFLEAVNGAIDVLRAIDQRYRQRNQQHE
jgi:hypothetical protein